MIFHRNMENEFRNSEISRSLQKKNVFKSYWLLLFTIFSICFIATNQNCIPRRYKFDSIVCVCNATYCDFFPNKIRTPLVGNFLLYSSSKSGLRFARSVGSFKKNIQSKGVTCRIHTNETYQKVEGFGGAFTDSAGINILSLSEPTQNLLLRSYFSEHGIEYTMGRVPIGGTDFSTRAYTYNDNIEDESLKSFNLTNEDYIFKINLIKRAQSLSKNSLKLVASCWSPPAWMKTNHQLNGFGLLKKEYYRAYAQYHLKFLDAYKKEEIDFWCVTTGNEPINGLFFLNKLNALGWTPISQKKWIGEYFGPMMRSSYPNTCILALDDQRYVFPWWLTILMEDKLVSKYINGSGVHWYWDFLIPATVLRQAHEKYPDLLIINTESSYGDKPWHIYKTALGSWKRADDYAYAIINAINNWISGWIDWNLALDENGGPNWVNNFVDSAIIVNKTSDEFYKQPIFYALGHFSKFITPGSVRVKSIVKPSNIIHNLCVKRPDNSIVIILLNRKSYDVSFTVLDNQRGSAVLNIPKYSVHSFIYQ